MQQRRNGIKSNNPYSYLEKSTSAKKMRTKKGNTTIQRGNGVKSKNPDSYLETYETEQAKKIVRTKNERTQAT